MKKTVSIITVLMLYGSVSFACAPSISHDNNIPAEQEEEPAVEGDNVTDAQTVSTMESVDGLRIAWDSSSETALPGGGGYARVIKLSTGNYIATYECGGVVVSDCTDGKTWSAKRIAIPGKQVNVNGKSVYLNACNAEIIELSDGTILSAANYRPAAEGIAPYSIAIARSTDGGKTFSSPKVIYEAGTKSADGCWEPAFLELPDGTVQCYFANEAPYTSSDEQEISMLSSSDKGVSWTREPVTVCFRAKHRDGMPVPRIIGDEIVVSIEDNGRGELQPVTVRCKLSDNWSEPVLAGSENRAFALSESLFDGTVYMGAPYLLQLPDGTTLMSYQTTYGRGSAWDLSCMEVAVGDSNARNFGNLSRPFNVANDRYGLWNSIMLWDDYTVLAVSSTNKNGAGTPYIKKGHLMPEFKLTAESADDWNFFAGKNGKAETLLGAAGYENGRYHFKAKVKDGKLFKGKDACDGVCFYLDVVDGCYDRPYAGIYCIKVSHDGENVSLHEGNNGEWQQIRVRDMNVKSVLTEDGYMLDVSVDSKVFRHANGKSARVAFKLCAATSEYNSYEIMMEKADASKPATWLKVWFQI